jgi:hypothetical protein
MPRAFKMLDMVGIGPEDHNFGGLKTSNFAARCIIEAL